MFGRLASSPRFLCRTGAALQAVRGSMQLHGPTICGRQHSDAPVRINPMPFAVYKGKAAMQVTRTGSSCPLHSWLL